MGRPLAVVCGLVLLLTYLLIESRIPDRSARVRMQAALQGLQLHDAELNRDVLMVRAGLMPSYDSLARTRRSLSGDLENLQRESRQLMETQVAAIHRRVPELSKAIAYKQTRIEYLKTDAALLRNSLAYFSRTVGALRRDDAGPARTGPEVAALSHVMLGFVQTPGPDIQREAERWLARLSRARSGSGGREPLIVHGRLILEVLPRLDHLVEEIVTAPTAAYTDALQQALVEYSGAGDARAQRFRTALYVVALILLGYLVWQYIVLRVKARELRKKEIQLIQANKMTALGTLVSGVAHEVNNPNQVVMMNAGVLASAWADAMAVLDTHHEDWGNFTLAGLPYAQMRGTIPELTREVQEAARRIERLLGDLKDFARPGKRAPEVFQVNDVVNRALRLLAHVLDKRTEKCDVRLAAGLPLLRGDPQQVEQMVVNLVMNALEALPDRRHGIVVSTWRMDENSGVALEVRDEGVGIPRENIQRLGEPFFTTKEASGGTGLGLAITSSLVRSHRGSLHFVSEPGKGTRATVILPASVNDVAQLVRAG